MDFETANKAMHPVEKQWHYKYLTPHGYKCYDPPQQGFVRHYTYRNPDTGRVIVCNTGANSDYWSDPSNGARGYWADLNPYLAACAVEDERLTFTKVGWDASNLNFDQYIKDVSLPVPIDVELYDYFAEVVPPVDIDQYGYLMGEAVDTNEAGDFTYMMFVKRGPKYYYIGDKTESEFEPILKQTYYSFGRLSVNGGWIIDQFYCNWDTYKIQACLNKEKGWIKYATPQDEWYFGFWINDLTLQMVTYAEGDFSITNHVNDTRYHQEYWRANNFYRGC